MTEHLVPGESTVTELEQKAAEAEEQGATELREQAKPGAQHISYFAMCGY